MKPKRKISLILLVVANFCLALGLVGAVIYFLPSFDPNNLAENLTGWRGYVVMSGSMEPSLKLGSVVFTKKQSFYKVGDIVTFAYSRDKNQFVTHRITDINQGKDNVLTITTKGDANQDVDSEKITGSTIVGKAEFIIPYLGYAADFAKSPKGFIFLVVVPATIIIYEELKNIGREFKKFLAFLKNKLRRKNTPALKEIQNTASHDFPKIAIVIPAIGAFLIVISVTSAFFGDKEASLGNIFSAASNFSIPTPTPTGTLGPSASPSPTLVINEVLPDTLCFQGQTEAQWLEVYNGTAATVNLKNFKITDGISTIDLVNSNTDVPAGNFALLAHSDSIWGADKCYQDNGAITANLGGQLNIDTGLLQLQDSGNTVIDTVQWGTVPLNPTQNQSIERDPDGKDSATGINFNAGDFVVRATPQPGL